MKVWVEAEQDKSGDVAISLRDIRIRRKIFQKYGEHIARVSLDDLSTLGFPGLFLEELKKGWPVQFRMNLPGFEMLLTQGSEKYEEGGVTVSKYFKPARGKGLGGLEGWPVDPDHDIDEYAAFIRPAPPLGSRTSASFGGKHIGVFGPKGSRSSEEVAVAALREIAEDQKYFPDLFYVDDHGGVHLVFWEDYA